MRWRSASELYDIEIISVAKPVADVALDECVDAMP